MKNKLFFFFFIFLLFCNFSYSISLDESDINEAKIASRTYLNNVIEVMYDAPYDYFKILSDLSEKTIEKDREYIISNLKQHEASLIKNKVANKYILSEKMLFMSNVYNDQRKYAKFTSYIDRDKHLSFLYNYIIMNSYRKFSTSFSRAVDLRPIFRETQRRLEIIEKESDLEIFQYYLIKEGHNWKVTYDLFEEFNLFFNDLVTIYVNEDQLKNHLFLKKCHENSKYFDTNIPYLCKEQNIRKIQDEYQIICMCKGLEYLD